MIAPALIYLALNHGDAGAVRGWAVPVATDIAFALAVLGMLGRRAPLSLKVFLTALAIMDDLGAIVVIAVFYSAHLQFALLAGAVAVGLLLHVAGRRGVLNAWVYAIGGVALWLLVFRSGVHATLAGVALAFRRAAARGGAPRAPDRPVGRLRRAAAVRPGERRAPVRLAAVGRLA